MITYNHAYSICFSMSGSTHETGDDLTPQQIRSSIMERLANLSDDELLEAVGMPFDSYEEDNESSPAP